MKFLLLLVLLLPGSVLARQKVVYGEDNRQDIAKVTSQKLRELSSSIAGRVKNRNLEFKDGIYRLLNIKNLNSRFGFRVCADENFATQPTVVDCTGFLIAEDLLVTAGHCVTDFGSTATNKETAECSTHSWLFDYKVNEEENVSLESVPEENIFGCKEVIYGVFDRDNDYALVRLDRKVKDRKPLKMNFEKRVELKDSILVVGHPSGLPLKVAGGAEVFSLHENYFSTNLDTFSGNSGSPVLNPKNLEVVGILVRGDTDYIMDEHEGEACRRVNVCDSSRENCKEDHPAIDGEHVTHIDFIKKILETQE